MKQTVNSSPKSTPKRSPLDGMGTIRCTIRVAEPQRVYVPRKTKEGK